MNAGQFKKGDRTRLRHGHKPADGSGGTPTYRSWRMMLARVRYPHYERHRYCAGVKVAKRWLKFENFLADMGIRPEGKTLDRIDPAGDYTPINCRWATYGQQRLNRRKRV